MSSVCSLHMNSLTPHTECFDSILFVFFLLATSHRMVGFNLQSLCKTDRTGKISVRCVATVKQHLPATRVLQQALFRTCCTHVKKSVYQHFFQTESKVTAQLRKLFVTIPSMSAATSQLFWFATLLCRGSACMCRH